MTETRWTLWCGGIAVQLLLLCVSARAADDPAELAERALAANPGLEAMRARVSELEQLSAAAGAWTDPVIGIDYLNVPVDTFSLNDFAMSGVQLNARQTIPPPGWSRLRERVARSRTRTHAYAAEEAANQLRREVFVLFFRLGLSRMLEAVTRQHVDRAEELLRAVRARYETGRAGQHELLRIQVLRDRLADDRADFDRSDRELRAALARTLSRPPETPFETPTRLEPVPIPGDVPRWMALAREGRPELQRLAQVIETAESAAELARVDGRPDVTVWAGYRIRKIDTVVDDGTDFFSAGISVPIPWGSRRRSRAEQAAHLEAARAARAERRAAVDRIESELTAIHARWTRAFEQAREYRENLTPAAGAALETAFADYRVGRADFTTLYEAEVELLDLERRLLTATVRTHIEAAAARSTIGAAPDGGTP